MYLEEQFTQKEDGQLFRDEAKVSVVSTGSYQRY